MIPDRVFTVFKFVINQVKPIEAAIVASLLWWSFILAVPTSTFDSAKAYSAMSNVAPEEVWSVIFFILAIVNLYGMISEAFQARMLGLICSCGLWAFVATMFAISDIATTGTGIYFIVACLNAFVVYKVGEQRG